jgi:SpoVK/Ycf46/Vps4 family AAA+-type ATPase
MHLIRPEIFSKYLGETEAVIRNLFATAKRVSPCIVFIDEMDSIACKRGQHTNTYIVFAS